MQLGSWFWGECAGGFKYENVVTLLPGLWVLARIENGWTCFMPH